MAVHVTEPDGAVTLRGRRLRGPLLLVVLAVVLAFAAVVTVRVTAADRDAAAAAAAVRTFAIGEDIPTTFGAVAVEIVEKVGGPTDGQLTGASHGITGLVDPTAELVEVTAVMTNQTRTTLAYTPDQWQLRIGPNGKPMPAEISNVGAGVLQPAASIELRLRFVAPRDGRELWAEFSESGRPEPISVDLGKTSTTPYGTDTTHQH